MPVLVGQSCNANLSVMLLHTLQEIFSCLKSLGSHITVEGCKECRYNEQEYNPKRSPSSQATLILTISLQSKAFETDYLPLWQMTIFLA
jgi:hypothetical protein